MSRYESRGAGECKSLPLCPMLVVLCDVCTLPPLLPLPSDVLGHPFGKVPAPRPYDANYEEAKIILTDPIDPIGKTVLAREEGG